MEKEGFIRTVTRLDDKVGLRAVSTDRHIQIRKLMATNERFMHIINQFDPWHLAKNISKNLVKLAKNKGLMLCFIRHLLRIRYFGASQVYICIT